MAKGHRLTYQGIVYTLAPAISLELDHIRHIVPLEGSKVPTILLPQPPRP
jgi:hypothetical protein